jgi:hypothetical protein
MFKYSRSEIYVMQKYMSMQITIPKNMLSGRVNNATTETEKHVMHMTLESSQCIFPFVGCTAKTRGINLLNARCEKVAKVKFQAPKKKSCDVK